MVTRQITQLTTACASTYLSAFSTLRRNHHWVVGYHHSGRSVSHIYSTDSHKHENAYCEIAYYELFTYLLQPSDVQRKKCNGMLIL
jgi:hypothetical protein